MLAIIGFDMSSLSMPELIIWLAICIMAGFESRLAKSGMPPPPPPMDGMPRGPAPAPGVGCAAGVTDWPDDADDDEGARRS